jgi:hypothetical protein
MLIQPTRDLLTAFPVRTRLLADLVVSACAACRKVKFCSHERNIAYRILSAEADPKLPDTYASSPYKIVSTSQWVHAPEKKRPLNEPENVRRAASLI